MTRAGLAVRGVDQFFEDPAVGDAVAVILAVLGLTSGRLVIRHARAELRV